MKQTLASFPITPATPWGSSPKVRLYADDQFRASTGELHPAGHETANYEEITLTPSGDGFTFPSSVVDTTDDSSNPNATYSAVVVNGNKVVYTLFDRWAFRASLGATISWDDLETSNVTRVPLRDDTAYSKVQTDLRIASALNVGGPMTTEALGRGYVDTTPDDPARPVLVGSNSPLLLMGGHVVTPQQYGAIADGLSHPLSTRYATLAAAQAAYSFATSLSQEIDYCACKKASNVAFGGDLTIGTYTTPHASSTTSVIVDLTADFEVDELAGQVLFLRYPNAFVDSRVIASNTATTITLETALSFDFHTAPGSVCGAIAIDPSNTYDCAQYAIGDGEHGYTNRHLNKPLYFPAGVYMFGADTWTVRNLVGGHIYGAGRYSTRLVANDTVWAVDGIWYSRVEGISFESQTTCTATVDVDGNVPGHAYATRGVQGVTWSDCSFDGGGLAQFTFAFCRQGTSNAQGSECLWLNCGFNGSIQANFYANGFNVLNLTHIGGNHQNYQKHAIYMVAGSIVVLSVGFQSTTAYTQVLNGGFDIDCSSAGVNDRVVIVGCRSESLRFYNGGSSQNATLIANLQQPSYTIWSAAANYALNTVTVEQDPGGLWKLYRVTTAGTSGGSEPTWPASGTVADGSVVWTVTALTAITAVQGVGMGNTATVGLIDIARHNWLATIEINTDYTVREEDEAILVDASGGNRTVTLQNYGTSIGSANGRPIIVKKADTSANTVTVTGTLEGDQVIPGGSRGYVSLMRLGGVNVSGGFYVVGKSF